jgi:hypothetical protein
MSGRGWAYDNISVERLWRSVKHEDVYLNGYATMIELLMGLTNTLPFTTPNAHTRPWAIKPRGRFTRPRAAVLR